MSNIFREANPKLRMRAEKAALRQREQSEFQRQTESKKKQNECSQRAVVWKEKILPNWQSMRGSAKVKDLCFKGIPSNVKGDVWLLLIGNELEITPELFNSLKLQVELAQLRGHVDYHIAPLPPDTDDDIPNTKTQTASVSLLERDQEAADMKPPQLPSLQLQATEGDITTTFGKSRLSKLAALDITLSNYVDGRLSSNNAIAGGGNALSQTPGSIAAATTNDGLFSPEPTHFRRRHTHHYLISSGLLPPSPQVSQTMRLSSEALPSEGLEASFGSASLRCAAQDANINMLMSAAASPMGASGADHVSSDDEHNDNDVDGDCDDDHIRHQLDQQQQDEASLSANASGSIKKSISDPTLNNNMNVYGRVSFSHMPQQSQHLHHSEAIAIDSTLAWCENSPNPSGGRLPGSGHSGTPGNSRHNSSAAPAVGYDLDIAVEDALGSSYYQSYSRQHSHSHGHGRSLSSHSATAGAVTGRDSALSPRATAITIEITPATAATASNSAHNDRQLSDEQLSKHAQTARRPSANDANLAKIIGVSSVKLNTFANTRTHLSKHHSSGDHKTAQHNEPAESDRRSEPSNSLTSEGHTTDLRARTSRSSRSVSSRTSSSGASESNLGLRDALTSYCNLKKEHETIALIEFDLPRTFPTLGFFHDGGLLHTGLERILQCFAHFRPEIGYVQGMSYLAAMLLLNMDEFQAFQCLANLIARRGNMDFYCLKKEAIDSHVLCFDFFYKQHLPLLYSHMKREFLTSEMYLLDWNLSLFAKALPLEATARIWDCYLCEGEVFLTRAALGLLRMYAHKLCLLDLETIMAFLMHFPEDINVDELLHNIAQIRIPRSKYEKVRSQSQIKIYGEERGPLLGSVSNIISATAAAVLGARPGHGQTTNQHNNNNNNNHHHTNHSQNHTNHSSSVQSASSSHNSAGVAGQSTVASTSDCVVS